MTPIIEPLVTFGQGLIVTFRADSMEPMVTNKDRELQAFAGRLNEALDEQGIPPKGKGRQGIVGKMFGVSQKGARKWLEGESFPDTDRFASMAAQLNRNTEYLFFGRGPKYPDNKDLPTPSSEAREDRSKYLQKPITDCIRIPALNVACSMGPGRMAPSQEEVIEEFAVSPAWLRKHTHISHPDNLAIITGYGDSMAGTFSDGDLLLVDRGVTEIKIDAVYVLARGEELFIKRLQRVPDGTLLMISDNERYKPYPITPSELPTFHVLGRVIMAMTKKIL